jgi:hypothetical protein
MAGKFDAPGWNRMVEPALKIAAVASTSPGVSFGTGLIAG